MVFFVIGGCEYWLSDWRSAEFAVSAVISGIPVGSGHAGTIGGSSEALLIRLPWISCASHFDSRFSTIKSVGLHVKVLKNRLFKLERSKQSRSLFPKGQAGRDGPSACWQVRNGNAPFVWTCSTRSSHGMA